MHSFIETGAIKEFNFENGKKHPKINVLVNNKWHRISYSMSARTDNQRVYLRQNLQRITKGQVRGPLQ